MTSAKLAALREQRATLFAQYLEGRFHLAPRIAALDRRIARLTAKFLNIQT